MTLNYIIGRKSSNTKYIAVYFRMGNYTEEDGRLNGLDCPFDDSPIVYANDGKQLKKYVQDIFKEEITTREFELAGQYPEVISNISGTIEVDLYELVCNMPFDPTSKIYSHGKESLVELWRRERWRWTENVGPIAQYRNSRYLEALKEEFKDKIKLKDFLE